MVRLARFAAGDECNARCIRRPASAARRSWLSPRNRISRASPPNLMTSPPYLYADSISAVKHVLISEVISSAPALPLPASFSDNAVNPEMSADSIDPSTLVHDGTGPLPSSTAIRGTNAVSASKVSLSVPIRVAGSSVFVAIRTASSARRESSRTR